MKRKYVLLTMGMILSILVSGGCSGKGADENTGAVSDLQQETAGTDDSQTERKEDALYGEVSEIGDSSLMIQTGTLKDMGQKPDMDSETKKEEGVPEKEDSRPSMLDLTGEKQEIAVTEDTIMKRRKGGGGPGEGNGASEPPQSDGEAPDKPGEMPEKNDEMPEKPEGSNEEEEITLTDISAGDIVKITLNDDGSAAEIIVMIMDAGMGGMGNEGPASAPDNYEAVSEYSSDEVSEGETFTSTGTDENAFHVLNGTAEFRNITVCRNSSDSTGGDAASFYGVGAAVLTTEGTACISGSVIETDAAGGAGIFAYGNGTVYVSDTEIRTKQDTSGGIHAAGGGTLYAWNLDVNTEGESSAAVRSDRGGGTMVIEDGVYVSNGSGSPAVYSTADIAVKDAVLTANGSEAVCIEGLNSLRLYDSDLTGNMSDDERNDCIWNVILYQSMSGDSKVGNSVFEMQGGTLKAENGGMFYTTNTESTFILSDVDITCADDSEFFLRCTGNANQRGWGTAGENGADCLFTAIKQEMEGDIIWDEISMLDFYLTQGSSLKGAVLRDETYSEEEGDGYCHLYIDGESAWIVTGNSTVSAISCEGKIVDEAGDTVTIKGSDGTVYIEGNSSYTVTTDSYEETADMSGASTTTEWEDYQQEKPSDTIQTEW